MLAWHRLERLETRAGQAQAAQEAQARPGRRRISSLLRLSNGEDGRGPRGDGLSASVVQSPRLKPV